MEKTFITTQKLFSKFLLATAFFAVAACGSAADFATLPDDPEMESPSQPESEKSSSAPTVADAVAVSESTKEQILKLYDYVDPKREVPTDALETALLYYHNNKASIKNQNYLSVIDFRKKSTLKRFFIIEMKSGTVWSIRTAHGKGSDANHDGFAETFSNKSGSNASSVGFYKAAETYQGKYGTSLRLDGLSSTNSNARARAVVIHGADYVQEKEVIQGRSWGCPAVAFANRDKVMSYLKGGSIIYAVGK
jgi:hypothetical protein